METLPCFTLETSHPYSANLVHVVATVKYSVKCSARLIWSSLIFGSRAHSIFAARKWTDVPNIIWMRRKINAPIP